MPKLISVNQGGFVSGRAIAENIGLAQELTHSLKLKARGGNVIFKLDMSKASDRVNWGFLQRVLKAFGFNDQWISLIHNCISQNYFSIALNGSLAGFFKSSRGLRQGDPLSPLLFILSEEPLSRGLSELHSSGKLLPYKVPRTCPMISHLLFADDCIIFTNGSKRNIEKLMSFLNEYAATSGQESQCF